MDSMTSRSCRPGGRATPTTSTSPGPWGPIASSSRCSRPRSTASSRRTPPALLGRLGGLAVLNLEGIFCRYEDAEAMLKRIATLSKEQATREMQEIYAEPVKPELIAQRIQEIKAHGVVAAASLTPQRVRDHYEAALEAGLDIMVIQGTVVSAEHVSDGLRAAQPQGVHRLTRSTSRSSSAAAPATTRACTSCAPARPACSSGSDPARSAPRAACSASASPRPRRSPMWPRPARSTCSRRASTQGHRRRRHAQRRRRRQGHRLRRRRGHARLGAGALLRGARPGLQLGHGHVPPVAAPRHPRARRRRRPRSRRSSSAPRGRTTATTTSWARCAPRWRRAATATSRSSTGPS